MFTISYYMFTIPGNTAHAGRNQCPAGGQSGWGRWAGLRWLEGQAGLIWEELGWLGKLGCENVLPGTTRLSCAGLTGLAERLSWQGWLGWLGGLS